MNNIIYMDEEHNRIVQTILDNFDEYFETGICLLLLNLINNNIINELEQYYIKDLLPKKMENSLFCGYVYQKEPRIKWLKSILK